MPNQREDPDQPELTDEEGGGPVKSFLEHLEDLRWTLIKSAAAIIVAMLVCLLAGNHIVAILAWPLEHGQLPFLGKLPFMEKRAESSDIAVVLGTNVIGKIPPALFGLSTNATNVTRAVHLVPVPNGTNFLLAAVFDSEAASVASHHSPVLKNYTPMGGVMVALKLMIYGGFILSSPFLLYFIGQFVLPALKVKEKAILYRAVFFGTFLFFLGVVFCYFIVAGITLVATVQFSEWMGFSADEWRAEDYITFMCRFMLGMGLGFELPVVILTMVKIGLIDYRTLVRFRSYAIVVNLVIAAVVTPSGDPFTMFLMGLPLHLLYEISVLIAWYWARKERKLQIEAT